VRAGHLGGGDAKVAGTAVVVGAPGPTEDTTFVLEIREVSLVEVDGDQLRITSWSPEAGTNRRTRR
jgi:hypothetical protein